MDELKFHKHWNSFYKLKITRIFEVLEDVYAQIHDPIEFFHKLATDYAVAPEVEEGSEEEGADDAKKEEKEEGEDKPKGRLLSAEEEGGDEEGGDEEGGDEEGGDEEGGDEEGGDDKKKEEEEKVAPNEFIGLVEEEHWERLGGALHLITTIEKPKTMKIGIDIKGFEKDIAKKKESFICLACDMKTHLSISELDKTLTVEETVCSEAVEGYRDILNRKILKVDKTLAIIDDIMDMFASKNEKLQKNKELNHKIKRIAKAGEKCLENNAFNMVTCQEFCSYHSIIDVSPAFFGDLTFFREIVSKYAIFEKLVSESLEKLEAEAAEAEAAEKEKSDKKPKERILTSSNLSLIHI